MAPPDTPAPETRTPGFPGPEFAGHENPGPELPGPEMPGPESPVPQPHVVRVREPSDLVAAVPMVMGFHPRESLVLLSMGGSSGRRLGLTLRVDLPEPEHASAVVSSAAGSLLIDSPAGAAVIVVDHRGSGADPPGRELVDLARAELEAGGVNVHTAIWAEGTTAGSRWSCFDRCCGGVLPDPSTTPLAAASVLGGQVVYADRGELQRTVEPVDPDRIRRREQLLIEAIEGEAVGAILATGADLIDRAVGDAAAGRLDLDDTTVVELAIALSVPALRDDAIRHGAGPQAAAAEQLWAALARETPDPEAAEPATLLAVTALMRGDGALANVALDRAEQAWPGHRFARLLRSVAAAGIRPAALRASLSSVEQPLPRQQNGEQQAAQQPARGRRPQPMSRAQTRQRRRPVP